MLTRHCDCFIIYKYNESLCCVLETNKMLYVNYSSIKLEVFKTNWKSTVMKEIESVNGRWGYLFKILYLLYMNGHRDYHTKGSKSHKDKYQTISLTHEI